MRYIVGLIMGFILAACMLHMQAANAHTNRIVYVHIPQRCLAAEDSAAHLKLVEYGSGDPYGRTGIAVYACPSKGW